MPVVVNNTAIYGAARGGHVRELASNWQANGLLPVTCLCVNAHLFDNLNILDMAYAKARRSLSCGSSAVAASC